MTSESKRTRYQWPSIKEQYLASDIDEVFTFLKQVLVEYKTSNESCYSRNTKGWKEEKAEVRRRRVESIKEKVASAHGFSAEKLLEIKWNVLNIVEKKLADEGDHIKFYDLKLAWEMLKAEVGEAAIVAKHEINQPFDWFNEK